MQLTYININQQFLPYISQLASVAAIKLLLGVTKTSLTKTNNFDIWKCKEKHL